MMFHVKLYAKALLYKGFFLFLLLFFTGCVAPRQGIDVSDYVLRQNGKQILGHEKGLTAFIFENNPDKISFRQFLTSKFELGNSTDLSFHVFIEGNRYTVFLYDNTELEQHFETRDFIASNVARNGNVTDMAAKFLALSVINEYNEDCLADGSLYQNMIIKYLRELKHEYYTL